MKKLMTMIAAVATAFGLFAADALNGTSFEADEAGVSELTWTPGYPWSTTITDALDLGAYASEGPAYAYSDAKPRRDGTKSEDNVFPKEDTNANFLKLDTGSATVDRAVADGQVFFDQVIKFTGFEDMQTNFTAGTKIALWTSAIEDDEDTDGVNEADTNLYVAVGTANSEAPILNLKIDVGDDFDFNAWHRVTIKNADKVSGNYLGFFIWIDGEMATIDGGKVAYFQDTLSKYESYYDKGQLFISMDGTSATVANIGFQGVGSLDDVVVDAQGPAFAVLTVDVTFAELEAATIVKVVDEDDNEFTDFTEPISVKPGQLTVTLTAKPGWILKKTTVTVSTDDADDGEITLDLSEIADEADAQITNASGTTYYTKDQLAALLATGGIVDGDTVTFLKAVDQDDGHGNILYAFSPNTTIEVLGIAGGSVWNIFVANYTTVDEESGEMLNAGVLEYYLPVESEKQINVTLDSDVNTDGDLVVAQFVLGGDLMAADRVATIVAADAINVQNNITIGDGALLQADAFAGLYAEVEDDDPAGAKLTLVGEGKVMSKTQLVYTGDLSVFGNEEEIEEIAPAVEGGYYTYQLATAPDIPWVGEGTEDNPYQIATYDDLVALQTWVADGKTTAGVYFKQMDNIDMSATATDGWVGIGTLECKTDVAATFKGVYDGDNKEITNLTFSGNDYNGLFASAYGATIKNLKVAVAGIKGGGAAAFVGCAENCQLVNLTSTGNIGTEAAPGTHTCAGIAVRLEGSTAVACTNKCEIWNNKGKLGGLFGIGQSSVVDVIENCSNEGAIHNLKADLNNDSGVGGIFGVGYNWDTQYITLNNCRSIAPIYTVEITGSKDRIGSLVGRSEGKVVTLQGENIAVDTMSPIGPMSYYNDIVFGEVIDGGLVKICKATDFVAGKTYKTMKSGLTPAYQFADAGTIAFNTNLFEAAAFNVTAAEHFEVAETAAGGIVTFTATAIPQFDVTFSKDGAPIAGSDTKVYRDESLTDKQIPEITDEGAWDVNPTNAVITCNTNFNFTVKKAEEPVKPGDQKTANSMAEAEAMPIQAADAAAEEAGQVDVLKKVITDNGDGTFTVTVDINTEAAKFVAPEVAVEPTLEAVMDAEDGAQVTVALPAAKVTPGLYYSIDVATELGGNAEFLESARVLATSAGVSLKVTKPEGGKAFFKVSEHMTATPANKD